MKSVDSLNSMIEFKFNIYMFPYKESRKVGLKNF